eukprot:3595295-Pleurochrysis_carterae.AAC.3
MARLLASLQARSPSQYGAASKTPLGQPQRAASCSTTRPDAGNLARPEAPSFILRTAQGSGTAWPVLDDTYQTGRARWAIGTLCHDSGL